MGKKEEKKDSESKFPGSTPPADVRFSQVNVTKYCYTMFIDYQRCTRLLGAGYEKCNYFKTAYSSLCPNVWIEKFEQQLEDGTFPVCLPPKEDKGKDKKKK